MLETSTSFAELGDRRAGDARDSDPGLQSMRHVLVEPRLIPANIVRMSMRLSCYVRKRTPYTLLHVFFFGHLIREVVRTCDLSAYQAQYL